MSYIRDPHYVWRGGEWIHIDDVAMNLQVFDALVMMRLAQMTEEEKEMARKLAVEMGEFGADELRAEMGLPTQMGEVARAWGLEEL